MVSTASRIHWLQRTRGNSPAPPVFGAQNIQLFIADGYLYRLPPTQSKQKTFVFYDGLYLRRVPKYNQPPLCWAHENVRHIMVHREGKHRVTMLTSATLR